MDDIFIFAERDNKASLLMRKNSLDFFNLYGDGFPFFNAKDLDANKDLYVFFCDKKFDGWTQDKNIAKRYFDDGYPCFNNSAIVI